MFEYAQPLHQLIEQLRKFPGIGQKSAQRLAFYILSLPPEEVEQLIEAITEVKKSLFYCSICNNITDVDPCLLCTDDRRNNEQLCVVEEPFNVASIEKTGIYHGRYHVLLGSLSPLKGIGPDELKLEKLINRLKIGQFKELIIATNPTAEGEATAALILQLVEDLPIKISRLAMGLPVGGDLDFADQQTIKKALEGRTEIKNKW
ncbi:MAG TPA: recombination mediator RecR [Candidatus Saccharicenans sp.]|jgi:recombination protein RecR|nr:recombination mediator RecR [Candidatus Saccharicenans sp.]HQO75061.1 recombination mediator RecR [Candidatus Saccharicenans sp.]HUM79034.1 recombination mediator RecR [Candidatus Saccharicenans sp.]